MNNTKLTKAAKKSRAEYFKRYRREHPEKVAIWSRNYWTRRAEKEQAALNGESTNGVLEGDDAIRALLGE